MFFINFNVKYDFCYYFVRALVLNLKPKKINVYKYNWLETNLYILSGLTFKIKFTY